MSPFPQRHPRIFATLLLLLVGGAGFGVGFAADRALFHYRFARAMATGRLPREPVFPDRARINGVLTTSQRAKLPRTGGRLPEDFPMGPGPAPSPSPEGTAQ